MGSRLRVDSGEACVDMPKVGQRKRTFGNSFLTDSLQSIENAEGVDLIFGEASFTGKHSVKVLQRNGDVKRLSSKNIFNKTGGRTNLKLLD